MWEEISNSQDIILLGKKEMNSRAYCASFNFKGADQQKKVGTLSGGERNRVHLAKMLRSGANLLLLDEPTNDLDVDTLRALEEALEDFAGCAVIISHDRWILVTATLALLAGCSAEPRSASYFASHQAEAAKVAADCQAGAARGQECANALAGQAAAKDEARLKLYRRSF